MSGLKKWIVSGSNSSHGCGLIASVTLCGILKIRIWASRTVDTDVARQRNVWTTVGFAHYSHNSNTTSCSNSRKLNRSLYGKIRESNTTDISNLILLEGGEENHDISS